MELREIKSRLIGKIEENQLLGFDYASQALQAILMHDDYALRWDIQDDARFVELADAYRNAVFTIAKRNAKLNGSML